MSRNNNKNISIYNLLGFNYLGKIKDTPESEILDPITTIFKLSLLYFKLQGTKICIDSNCIYFQDPGILQSITRYYNGDQRTDLHKLNNAIKKSLEWFNTPEYGEFIFIFDYVCKGMVNLQKVYNFGLAKVTLEHYITLINTTLESQKIQDKTNSETNENLLYDQFKKLWSINEIKLICDIIRLISNYQNNNKPTYYYIKAIESILKGKDIEINNIITKINSG